ncbi:MAG: methyltransferase domain-containing protein [Thermomicrobiales bacterium]
MPATDELAYSAIDRTEAAERERLIRLLDTQNEWEDIQSGKRIVLDQLDIQPGWTVLDAGSGTGYDLLQLGELVGPAGRAVGIDASKQLLDIARQRLDGTGLPVELLHADIRDLPFEDDTFDAVRSERVIQHVDDIPAAIDELIRVTKPGGRIVIFDTDVSTFSVSIGLPDELEARLHEFWRGGPDVRNIRHVPFLMEQRGLASTSVTPQLGFHDGASWSSFLELQGDQHPALLAAREQGIIDSREYEQYVAAQDRAIANGTFLTWAVMLVVAGSKPSEPPSSN